MYSGRWSQDNCYVDYTIEAIVMKEYAIFRELLDEVAKRICVDLRFNSVKLRYKIEGSNAPLEIHNDMGVMVYVSLKKDNNELAKYPICVSVFVNDCELTDRNILEDGVGMCGIDGGDIVDTQALVLSVPNNNDYMNCDIIKNIKHKVVLEDQVYKDKETLKDVMAHYTIEHRFQWKTDRSSQHVAWKAKEKAIISLRGTPSGSYGKLPSYLYILDTTYPGSHIAMKKIDENQFLYLFISLFPFIKGFESCRPIIVVDGSHLRGMYNGIFVSTSTVDGAGNILPLPYGIIDSKNDVS
ncbi:hypothetical protein RDI58_004078 [Solanum bulbocastanum]|uniref:Transposase n=1 Tax=Solanum bulbocastanum TaxID=147425 RepID=A0AAN8YL76_SOLBU